MGSLRAAETIFERVEKEFETVTSGMGEGVGGGEGEGGEEREDTDFDQSGVGSVCESGL